MKKKMYILTNNLVIKILELKGKIFKINQKDDINFLKELNKLAEEKGYYYGEGAVK